MLRLLLSPRWIGITALLLACLTAFVVLGNWQLGRAGRPVISAAEDPAPVALESALDAADPPSPKTAGRRITVTGTYQPAEQLLVTDQAEGTWVLTPLRTADGMVVPVVRGAVGPGSVAPAAPSGRIELAGRLQPPQDFATLDGELPVGTIPSVNLPDLAGRVSGRVLQAGYVIAAVPDAGLVPVIPQVLPSDTQQIRLQNLAYAFQWWFFGLFAIFWYFRMLRDDARAGSGDGAVEPLREPVGTVSE